MKLKGIKPVEQHVEKAVLGVCGAAFVGALVWQLFLTKNEVKVGPASKPISAAFDPARDEAKKLEAKVGNASPEIPEVPKLAIRDALRLGVELPATSGQAFALGAGPGVRVGADTGKPAGAAVALPTVPAPASVVAATYRNTFSPVEKLRTPALAALLPAEQPFDKASVSVEGIFDGVAFRSVLESDPDGPNGPATPVPINWWRDPAGLPAVEVLGVEMERKTIRNPDGTVPSQDEIVVVPVAPGRSGLPAEETVPSVMAWWERDARSAGDIPPMLDEVRSIGPVITRPEFYETIAGPEWERPREAVVAVGENDQARQQRLVKRQLAELDKDITEIEDKLGTGGRRAARDRAPERGGTTGSGGRGGRMSGGGGRGGERESAPSELNESQRKALEENLKRLQDRREVLVKKLESLGGTDEGPKDSELDEVELPWLDNAKIDVWAHDLTVQPGAVYQYRMRLVVNNPMFGRGLQEDQKALAEQKLLRGTWSEWTAPVTIDRDREFFITSAVDNDPVTGRPKAMAEVFVFYYGYYRSQGGSFEPGDKLNLRVNLPDELKLADMKALEEAFSKGQLPGLAPIVRPDERENQPGGGRGRQAAPDDRGAARAGQNQPVAADALMSIAGPKFVAAGVDSVLLGVRGVPGEGQTRYQAVVRDLAQQVVAMAPDDARGNAAYKRLEASVKAGKEALEAPKVEEEPKRPEPRPRPVPTRPRGGGGGGGGGGG
jgi:hypothetical protein